MQADSISTSTVVLWIVTGLSTVGGGLGLLTLKSIKDDIKTVAVSVAALTGKVDKHSEEMAGVKGFFTGKGIRLP